ncbi:MULTISPECIES: MYXO-CTERM sorting domain-containing protein [Pseudomonas]|jgi:MYXO-CTERM domain-containing protein|uniref:MYXO-CTERM sorting domain-containing protein n=1 Tax=Pseudomonas TaxID=286 RepID=UPI0002A2E90B|nr:MULTISPECIES: MYXO-CTERM sorting domain-containing protein [Pseudomonas]MBB1605447.1 hypothetical protein [Pseudomonas sp. UMC76]MBB1641392.1 hypothetical protein [Pseudomonas sp. UME83]NTX89429.1 hypothetical protein [Pseudomonas sp. UMA643]NTY19264.1 hypothetical protein [Pseudomonas sp. UMC3103]NTY24180.1 hypothetical protein [Pseudomonas sp. UMA603]
MSDILQYAVALVLIVSVDHLVRRRTLRRWLGGGCFLAGWAVILQWPTGLSHGGDSVIPALALIALGGSLLLRRRRAEA